MESEGYCHLAFLFTDIEKSSALWEQHPTAMERSLAWHDAVLNEVIERHQGHVLLREGDSFRAAFEHPLQAVNAALEAQIAFVENAKRFTESSDTAPLLPIRVRMALHWGTVYCQNKLFIGACLSRGALLVSLAFGEQILLTHAIQERLQGSPLPDGVSLQDLGLHRLKDLGQPEPLFQLCHPRLPAQFPPLASLGAQKTNLPVQLTSFIGRERELEEIQRRLRPLPQSSCRLLTLIGPGGVGKTRLSLQVGAGLLDDFSDGVWLVELATLKTPELVLHAIARVFGIQEEADRRLQDVLCDYLRPLRLLVILDNCEHLLTAGTEGKCAEGSTAALEAVSWILAHCPQVVFLATSRQPLGLTEEQVYPLSPLSLPEDADVSFDRLLRYDAVRLFVELAWRVRPDFHLQPSNAAHVVSICQQVDGIPLALELAAARLNILSVAHLAERIQQRLHLLSRGSRVALPRQQTLRALIDWSYELLDEQEKLLFCRLAVFEGGATFEAITQIVDDNPQTWELLNSLVAKSLLICDASERATRFRMLETLREYAWEKFIALSEMERLRDRHREWFLHFALSHLDGLYDERTAETLSQFEAEHANFRAALAWCVQQKNVADELRLVNALQRFWLVRGYLSESLTYLKAALDHAKEAPPSGERYRAYLSAGAQCWAAGNSIEMPTYFEKAVAEARALQHASYTATALANYGAALIYLDQIEKARVLLEEAYEISRQSDDQELKAAYLGYLATVAQEEGNYVKAEAITWEVRRAWERLSNQHALASAINNLGIYARKQGDLVKARAFAQESLLLRRQIGDKHGFGWSLLAFAELEAASGRYERAARLFAAAKKTFSHGSPLTPSEKRDYEAHLRQTEEALGEALFTRYYRDGEALSLEEAIAYALEENEAACR
ncbi:MAG TPA: tetratricopeptide repeat protein [Chthonomonas sp.]|uniref:tetratricopeptide repeat protein n=1 Tax=Chthonomonas sp. TaxID=2282153 RepID=UPI002B4AFC36|nr:tetratricopeptide repeat protein [Chthonomonas sp.]HLI47220.1 tetratricopeptide repeat protein [Chthonomonas sp.]